MRYSPSIIQSKKECWFCHSQNELEIHHVMNGNGLREKSERYGLKIWLCRNCHDKLHFSPVESKRMLLKAKQAAEAAFLKKHTIEEWMREFHRNYLDCIPEEEDGLVADTDSHSGDNPGLDSNSHDGGDAVRMADGGH